MTEHWHWLQFVQTTKRIEHLQCFPEALSSDGKTHRQKQRRMDFYAQRGAIAIRWHWAQSLTVHLNRKSSDDSESLAKQNTRHVFSLGACIAVIVCYFYSPFFLFEFFQTGQLLDNLRHFALPHEPSKRIAGKLLRPVTWVGFKSSEFEGSFTWRWPWLILGGVVRWDLDTSVNSSTMFFLSDVPREAPLQLEPAPFQVRREQHGFRGFKKSQKNWSFTVRREDDGEFEVSWIICCWFCKCRKKCEMIWNSWLCEHLNHYVLGRSVLQATGSAVERSLLLVMCVCVGVVFQCEWWNIPQQSQAFWIWAEGSLRLIAFAICPPLFLSNIHTEPLALNHH